MARREWRTRKYKGLCYGKHLWLRRALRTSTSEVPADPILIWGDQKITVDARNLPARVAKAIPKAYGNPQVTAADWEPFVLEADGKHLFREL